MTEGMVHLYYGKGKGKTTAAAGLAIRALGHGIKVTFVQFLKDGTSGELAPLMEAGAKIVSGRPGTKFTFLMTEKEKEETRLWNDRMLEEVISSKAVSPEDISSEAASPEVISSGAISSERSLLILDELCAAVSTGLVSRELAKKAVLNRPKGCEVVMTGREPEAWMKETADYITEMKCEKHPYSEGITARAGIEY